MTPAIRAVLPAAHGRVLPDDGIWTVAIAAAGPGHGPDPANAARSLPPILPRGTQLYLGHVSRTPH